jgi:uncharacterized RDD family membrane protein YckC
MVSAAVPIATSYQRADTGARILAFILDSFIAIPIGIVAIIPIVGQLIATMLLLPYWLFRDFGGGSIGKRLFGLRVVDYEGNIASGASRLKRNSLFGAAVVLLAIPVIGDIGMPLAFTVVCFIEIVMMATRGERIGDREAKCLVVKKVAPISTPSGETFISPGEALSVATISMNSTPAVNFCRACGTRLPVTGACTCVNR